MQPRASSDLPKSELKKPRRRTVGQQQQQQNPQLHRTKMPPGGCQQGQLQREREQPTPEQGRGKGIHVFPVQPPSTATHPTQTCDESPLICEARCTRSAAAAAARACLSSRKPCPRPRGRPPRALIVFRSNSRRYKYTAGIAVPESKPLFHNFSERLLKMEWFGPPSAGVATCVFLR